MEDVRGRDQPVSIKDVAKAAGVSIGTVSNVLTGKRAVKPALQARVREAVAALRYEPDRAASRLGGGKVRIIGILVPHLTNPFFTSLVAAVEASVRQDGYEVIVSTSNGSIEEEERRLAILLAWRPAGLVIVPCEDDFAAADMIKRSGTPYVVVDRLSQSLGSDTITVDNFAAGVACAEHILDLGHCRVVVAASTMKLRNIRERYQGIESVFRARNLSAPRHIEVGPDFEIAAGRLEVFVRDGCQASAFIALTNFGTLAVLSALQQKQLRIPEDISVVGFDDYIWMRAVSPPLTAVRQPVEAMGQRGWARLKGRIEGNEEPFERESLACEFVVRGSTAPHGVTAGRERAA